MNNPDRRHDGTTLGCLVVLGMMIGTAALLVSGVVQLWRWVRG